MRSRCDEMSDEKARFIGAAAYYDFIAGKRAGLDLNAVPNLKLGE